jgi:ABC-type nitrate/sulfonate/bicarbonate transport system substrate-binding protein
MTMKTAKLIASLAFAAALLPAAALAKPLELIVFFGGANWPLWVAADKGFFGAQGLEVNITSTPGSVYLVQNLVQGKFDIGFATFDNVVGYDEGQGEAPLDRPADLVAVVGGLTGGVRLMASPGIQSIADLKGQSLAVDAPSTGYSLVMRKFLEEGGLSEADYRMDNMGGTGARAQALMDGKIVATIVTSPIDQGPRAKGFRVLADSSSIGPYQATLFMVRREWARAHEAELVHFARAYIDAVAWLADPAHRDEAVALYLKHLPKANAQSAAKAWDALLGGKDEGLRKDGSIDMAGAATVLKLRSEFGRPRKDLTDLSRYVDESYYRKAVAMAPSASPTNASARAGGTAEARNMELVGYQDLSGRSAYQPLVHRQGERWIAYIGHHGGKTRNPITGVDEDNGTSIVDVTDPRAPKLLAHIPGEPGSGESGGAQMVRLCDGATLPKADKSKVYLLRPFGNKAHEIWDVTDPARPKILTTIVKVKGTHKSWWECDTGIAYLVSGLDGWRVRRMTQVYDLSDPAHPRFIRNFGLAGQQPGATGEAPEELHGPISTGPQGNRVYFGYGTNKRGILQIVDRKKLLEGAAEPTDANLDYPEVGRMYLPPTNGAHTTFPVLGVPVAEFAKDKEGAKRDFAVIVDESLKNECEEARQMVWIADITAEKHPFNVSSWTVPEASGNFCARGGRFGSHSSNENMTPIYYRRMVFIAFFNAGVRALDIRDPYHPKEVAYYIPAVTDLTDKRCVGKGAAERCKVAIQTNNVDVDDRGYVYVVDRANTGMHILQLSGDARQVADFR